MLYYDATLQKFVNSNSLLFDASTFTFSVHQIQTDYVNSTTGFETDGSLFLNDSSPIFKVADFEITDYGGSISFTPTRRIMPLTLGQVFIRYDGSVFVSGTECSFLIGDRSTADIFSLFSNNNVFNLYNLGTSSTVFQVTGTGESRALGTGAGFRFFERKASPTNYYTLFTDTSGIFFNLDYNGSSIATVSSAGVTTLVPTKIQNTLQTTGTQFLTLVPNSATTSAGQVIGTHGSLSYNVATSTLTVSNLTGTASVATRAVNVGTTLTTTNASFYLTFVSSNTTNTSQALNVATGLSYNPNSQLLTALNFSGTADGALKVAVSSSLSSILYPMFSINSTTNTTPGIAYVDGGIEFNPTTNTLTTTTFVGSLTGSATLIDNTLQTTGTQFLTMVPLSATTSAGQVVGTHGSLSYNVATSTLTVSNLTGTASTSSTITTSTAGAGTFFPVFTTSGTGGTSRVLSVDTGLSYVASSDTLTVSNLTGNASGVKITTSTTDQNFNIPFMADTSGNQTLLGETGDFFTYNPYTSVLTTYDIDNTRILTTRGYLYIYDGLNTANNWSIYSLGNTLYFNNFFSPQPIPLILNGDLPSVTVQNVISTTVPPDATTVIEMDSCFLTDGTNKNGVAFTNSSVNQYDTLATKTSPTSSSSGALYTMSIQECNPNNKVLLVSFPLNMFARFNLSSASAVMDVNITALTVSMTVNGGSFTAFSYEKPTLPTTFRYSFNTSLFFDNIQQPFFMLNIYIQTGHQGTIPDGLPGSDVYEIKVLPTFTTTLISGTATWVGKNSGAGFDLNIGTVHSTAPANFTFNTADPTCTALSITKNQVENVITLEPWYLNAEWLNFSYQRFFTSRTTAFEPMCFVGAYTYYDVTFNFTTNPTAYASLTFGLADSTGVNLTTGYSGRISILGSAYSSTAWATTGALICYFPATINNTVRFTITYPNTGRRKMISGTNTGSSSATDTNVPMVTAGTNTSTSSYNSAFWTITGSAVNGTITIAGRNS
jgi:hypothetical protein